MICYFSGTGNTRWVAQQLSEATGERLVDMAQALRNGQREWTLDEGERLGFCFPTHGWQPPQLVRRFIRESRFSMPEGAYVFALTTCGDDIGETMQLLNRELARKGLHADTLFSLQMPNTYVCLPFMHTDGEALERQKICEAEARLKEVAAIIKGRKSGVVELTKGPTPRLYSYVIGAYFNHRMITDRKFTVDANACIQCGRCAQVCPVENIAGAPPVWLHNGQCTCCLACYHYCPTHAINYGRVTRQRGQYYFNKRADRK